MGKKGNLQQYKRLYWNHEQIIPSHKQKMNTTEGNWMSLLREHSSDCEPDASVVTSNGMEKSGALILLLGLDVTSAEGPMLQSSVPFVSYGSAATKTTGSESAHRVRCDSQSAEPRGFGTSTSLWEEMMKESPWKQPSRKPMQVKKESSRKRHVGCSYITITPPPKVPDNKSPPTAIETPLVEAAIVEYSP
ncbi:hypothetical protein P8452_16731 [Trifolium repens]|nr:hypothetical protein P8452_16731 [Trifolium repens]